MPTHTTRLRPEADVVLEVVRGAAAVLDEPAENLAPLEDCLDTKLLELFGTARSNESVETGLLSFEYEGLTVTIEVDGTLKFEST